MNVQATAIRPALPASTRITVAGEEILLDPRGCAVVPRLGLLVVADLHLEKGSSLARRRQFLPPYDSHETLARLGMIIADHEPTMVICLGDSFHDAEAQARLPQAMRLEIERLASGRQWCWIAGNHDPSAPAGLCGASATELAVGALLFRHEPTPGAAGGEIAGHLHPGASVRWRGRSLRRRCFVADRKRLVLPAFGAYTGMLDIRSAPFVPLFRGDDFHAHLLGTAAVHSLSGAALARPR